MRPERARYGVVVRRAAGDERMMLVAPGEPFQREFGDDPVPAWTFVLLAGLPPGVPPAMYKIPRVLLGPDNQWVEVE